MKTKQIFLLSRNNIRVSTNNCLSQFKIQEDLLAAISTLNYQTQKQTKSDESEDLENTILAKENGVFAKSCTEMTKKPCRGHQETKLYDHAFRKELNDLQIPVENFNFSYKELKRLYPDLIGSLKGIYFMS